MKIHKIAIVAAMEQEALALFPNADKENSGRFTELTGTISGGIAFTCLICGPGVERAAEAAKMLCAQEPDLIMSIGVSGGLAPGLDAGTLVAASSIHSEIPVFPAWHETEEETAFRAELFPACGEIQCGPLVCVVKPVLTSEEKLELHNKTGAIAADMESIAVATAARAAKIPFTCVRAISDDHRRNIPAEAMNGVDENGKSQIGPIIKAIFKRPSLIFELIPMGKDYSRALKSLGTIFK